MNCAPNEGDLTRLRNAKGWSQRELAKRAYVHHKTVQYWEAQGTLNWDSLALHCIADVLEWELSETNTRARHGVMSQTAIDGILKQEAHQLPESVERRLWNARVTCGAKTRGGAPCRAKSVPGKRRCKLHGGMSTGPKVRRNRNS